MLIFLKCTKIFDKKLIYIFLKVSLLIREGGDVIFFFNKKKIIFNFGVDTRTKNKHKEVRKRSIIPRLEHLSKLSGKIS